MRVVIADDSALFREGLTLLLSRAGIEVTHQARTGQELLAYLGEDLPEVAILDIRMPPTFTDEGIETAHEIRRRFPSMGVLVLSTYAETAYAVKLLSDGQRAVGYMLKDRVDDLDTLLDALGRVAAGETVIDAGIIQRLITRPRGDDALDLLTSREREVLQLMAEGRSNAGIARQLFLGTKTVEHHIASVFNRLGINAGVEDNRRVLAVLTWMRGRPQDPRDAG